MDCSFLASVKRSTAITANHSGASKHARRYLTRRASILSSLSDCCGILGCMAFQVQRNMVAKQLQRSPLVPRPLGSDVQPTVSSVDFIVSVCSNPRESG
jgi:hypothetical protein